jgi:hypothetical protein
MLVTLGTLFMDHPSKAFSIYIGLFLLPAFRITRPVVRYFQLMPHCASFLSPAFLCNINPRNGAKCPSIELFSPLSPRSFEAAHRLTFNISGMGCQYCYRSLRETTHQTLSTLTLPSAPAPTRLFGIILACYRTGCSSLAYQEKWRKHSEIMAQRPQSCLIDASFSALYVYDLWYLVVVIAIRILVTRPIPSYLPA